MVPREEFRGIILIKHCHCLLIDYECNHLVFKLPVQKYMRLDFGLIQWTHSSDFLLSPFDTYLLNRIEIDRDLKVHQIQLPDHFRVNQKLRKLSALSKCLLKTDREISE